MRWLILALSLGTTFATLWNGIMLFITGLGAARTDSSSPFLWAAALCAGSLFGFIGGVLAFNHKAISLIFLLAAAVMTYLGYSLNHVLVFSFLAISVLTLIYIIAHRRSMARLEEEYEDDEYPDDAGDDDDIHDEYNEEDDAASAPLKYKMPKRRSSYLTSENAESLTIKSPQRRRDTKVCLSCGMEIPISYKYCPSCGAELHTPAEINVNTEPEDAAEEIMETEADTSEYNFMPRGARNMMEEDDGVEIDEKTANGKLGDELEDVEIVPVVRKTPSEDMDEAQDSGDVPFKPLNIPIKKQHKVEADSSYKSFGRYTQSRKRRKVSIFQRVLLALLILCIVGGVSWFMYKGISKVSPPEIEVSNPPFPTEPADSNVNISGNSASDDDSLVIAVPGGVAESLPYMEVSPARQVITTGNGVNLRENHTTNSRSIARVQANNTYNLLDQWRTDNASSLPAADRNLTGPWFRIQVGNNPGWIYGQYVMPIDGRAASLPNGYTDALLNSFGSNRAEIEGKLGAPRLQNRGDTTILEYTNLTIALREDKVQSIQVTGRGHDLVNNLAVGITFEEMTQIIGFPNTYRGRDRALIYLEAANRGIVILRENNGNIRSINIGSVNAN